VADQPFQKKQEQMILLAPPQRANGFLNQKIFLQTKYKELIR
jgi:hypothetical protein